MLFNNIDTTGVNTTLTPGIYNFNFLELDTFDPLDFVRVIGDNYFKWKYESQSQYNEPSTSTSLGTSTQTLNNYEYTEYADNLSWSAVLKVFEDTNFTIRTDDTFEFPNDDVPSNPIVDLEILQAGDYSVIADDYIGGVENNILRTDLGSLDSATISSVFFHDGVDLTLYGVEGSAALWVTEPGLNLINVNYDDDYGRVLFWDGAELNELSLIDGDNTVLLDAKSDEWGLVLLDAVKPSDTNTLTVESIDWIDSVNYPQLGDNVSLYTAGDINEADLVNNSFELATGTGDYSISTLGYRLNGDRSFFEGLGTEGSLISLSGLTQGEYQFNVLLDAIDSNNNDSFYAYNGNVMTLLTTGGNAINQTLEVPYGELTFIALDDTTKTGTTEFIVDSLQKVSDLPYELIQFEPSAYLGDIERLNAYQYLLGTGTGDRAVSTLGKDLVGDGNFFKQYGTEGSYITVDVPNGEYEFMAFTDKFDSNNNDTFYAYNGKDLIAIADTQSNYINNSIDVIYNQLSFIALDVNSTTGTTDFIISDLMRTGDLSYSPPVPISLTPDLFYGDVDFYDNQTRINNGTGDYAVSTLSPLLNGMDLSSYGTEGSFATWNNLENGTYEITYSLYASENDFNHDDIYFYDGINLELFDSRSSATTQSSATRWISESTTQQVEVNNGQLTLITLDTVDKSGTTQLRISKIEKLAGDLQDNNNDNNNQVSEIDTTDLGENPVFTSWIDKSSSTFSGTTPNTIGGENTTDVINFSTTTDDVFEFTITPGDFTVSVIDTFSPATQPFPLSAENVLYSPQIGTNDYLIDAFTWDLPAGSYSVVIETQSAQPVEYQYSLYSESSALSNNLFYFNEGFDLTNVGNDSHIPIIHPIFDYEEGWFTKKYPNGLSITEINNLESYITEEIDAIASTDSNLFSVTAEEANLYNITLTYHGNSNTSDISDINVDLISVSSSTSLTEGTNETLRSFTTNADGAFDTETITVDLAEGDYQLDVNYTGNELGYDKLAFYDFTFEVNDESDEYFYQEPPFPIPENNKDLGNDYLTGLNLGTLKPWESDSNTGTEYNQGYIYPSYHLGASYINETIGGEDVSDWMLFDLDETSYLNFFHNNAIASIVDSNQQVIVGSEGMYSGNLQAQLQPGSYGIQFSSEATLPESFNASIYLSVNDPNYAD